MKKKEEKVYYGEEKAVWHEEPVKLLAQKDFEIHQNDFHLVIKKGDDLSSVPKCYLANLQTEGVLTKEGN